MGAPAGACGTTLTDMSSILVQRHRVGGPGVNLGAATLDLGVPGLGSAGLGLTIQAAQQLEGKLGPLLNWEAQDLCEHVGGGHRAIVALVDRSDQRPSSSDPPLARDNRLH